MKKLLLTPLVAVILSGCTSTPISNERLNYLVGLSVGANKCAMQDMMDMELAVDAQQAVNYTLSTWTYDQNMANTIYQQYQSSTVSAQDCKMITMHSMNLVKLSGQHKSNVKETNKRNQEAMDKFSDDMRELNKSAAQTLRDVNANNKYYMY
ncbi:hypothetical protein PVK62_17055 [Aliivibrio sp. S3MY1]|uniref:hypothetical protein n=1 Tax=unclassified Aliivibrio TaxID=2645654 RepID=UPI0023782052|nr:MULTISPECIES: hypothetical protein [unclassified Aliivibrio]MDD9197533.1 hypothetical protein [Aliivibrio sp. S3MY1]MDD9200786.1 hypothetical protein [Aliivibrio sp. S2MY1]